MGEQALDEGKGVFFPLALYGHMTHTHKLLLRPRKEKATTKEMDPHQQKKKTPESFFSLENLTNVRLHLPNSCGEHQTDDVHCLRSRI